MTDYNSLVTLEKKRNEHFVVLKPRDVFTGWGVFSGSVYRVAFDDFTFGEVTAMTEDGVAMTQGSSATLSAGEFWHDVENDFLYVHVTGGGDPSAKIMVGAFELWYGTITAQIPRIPTDSSTRVVSFDGKVQRPASQKDKITDLLYGFIGDQRSSVTISNAAHRFERFIDSASFHRADVEIYHWVNPAAQQFKDFDPKYFKRVFSGRCKNFSYTESGGTFRVQIFDQREIFNQELRPLQGDPTYTFSTFPSLDPAFQGKPVRTVLAGVIEGAPLTNIDFDDVAPSNSTNRNWVAASGQNLHTQQQTVGGGVHTTTRTFVLSASGLRVGDTFENQGTSESAKITAVNYSGAPYIDHTTVVTPATDGQTVERAFVASVTIIQSEIKYEALYGRDFTVSNFAGTTSGIVFDTNLQTNLGMVNELSPSDQVYARIYAKQNDVTLGGPVFGGQDAGTDPTNNLTNPIVTIFHLLKDYLGVPEADIDTAAFQALEPTVTEGVGLAFPKQSSDNFPTFKKVLIDLQKSTLTKLFIDSDGKWTIDVTGPFGATDATIDESETTPRNQVNIEYSYDRLASTVQVNYAFREVPDNPRDFDSSFSTVSVTNNRARYLHDIEKTTTFEDIVLFRQADALTLATRISYVVGDRTATVSFRVKNKYLTVDLSDKIDLTRVKTPSAAFDNETKLTQSFSVTSVNKGLRSVSFEGNDQKGIEDNSGSW